MESSSEKRVLLAIVLSLGLLMLWEAFFAPPVPKPKPAQSKSASVAKSATAGRAGVKTAKAKPAPPKPALPVVEGTEAKDIVVQDADYKVVLSTQGALVKSWILKNYKNATNHPLDVVNEKACAQIGYPMSLVLQNSALAAQLNSAIYVVQPSAATLTAPANVTFTYSNGKIQVKKEFVFGPNYGARVRVTVSDGAHDLPVSVSWPGGVGDHSLSIKSEDKESKAFYDHGGGIKTVDQKKFHESRLIPGPLAFAGMEDRYFAGIFIPQSSQSAITFSRASWMLQQEKGKSPESVESLVSAVGSSEAAPLEFGVFMVPKNLDVLGAINPALESLVDFGWFGIIAKPLFLGMRWIYDHGVHNWGWAIVIFTVIINMLFFPLKLKSVKSAQAMQRIQPIIKGIQDKYKQYKFNDPRKQKMNQEVMKVYQEHGVNPVGGCLTMLPQLPIIYAFYEVLETSIAMRHSAWIWWIKDLSVPDPYYILPVLAIVLSFIMQKMTPMPMGDPAQQRMMMLAPLFVGFIFFYEAAGLTLYYFIYCLVAVLQQIVINRMIPPQRPAPPAASATAGGKKTLPAARRPERRRPAPVKSRGPMEAN